jgi:hypothetical protein
MQPPQGRRRFLAALGIGSIGFTAGCTELFPTGANDETEPPEDDERKPPHDHETGPRIEETFPAVFNDPFFESPPERSGATKNACEYGSLQEALDDLEENETLLVPAECGAYGEADLPHTDHITIQGEGGPTVQHLNADGPELNTETEIAEPVEPLTKTIEVEDASAFSPGDDIYLEEETNPWNEPHYRDYEGGGGTDETREFVEIASIDGNTITTAHKICYPYPIDTIAQVSSVDWWTEDVRITGLRIDGEEMHSPLRMHGIKQGWFDDLEILGSTSRGLALRHSMWGRFDNLDFPEPNEYASSADFATTNVYATNLRTTAGHYIVRGGSCGNKILVDGVRGHDVDGEVINSHHGGFYTEYRNVRTTGTGRLSRLRTRELLLENWVDETNNRSFQVDGRPYNVIVRNGIIRKEDATSRIWRFPDNYPDQEREIINMTFENIYIEEPYEGGWEEMGRFGMDGYGTLISENLTFRNITFGNEPLRREHIEMWCGYDEVEGKENITVENPISVTGPDDPRLDLDEDRIPSMDDYPRHSF